MKTSLAIHSYAVAGCKGVPIPQARCCAAPPPGLHPRKARLPGMAIDLARRAFADRPVPASTSVFFGTGFGCLTETEAFVENMIRKNEAEPRPRAFSASVHNAVASLVALDLKARGECHTFVHGELAFVHAVFAAGCRCARGGTGPMVAGSADELTAYVRRAREECGCEDAEPAAEGGAVLLCEAGGGPALAAIREVSFGFYDDLSAWVDARLPPGSVDAILAALPPGVELQIAAAGRLRAAIAYRTWIGNHPSGVASAAAIAAGVLAGEVDPGPLSLPDRPERLAVITTSCHGDAGLIVLERSP